MKGRRKADLQTLDLFAAHDHGSESDGDTATVLSTTELLTALDRLADAGLLRRLDSALAAFAQQLTGLSARDGVAQTMCTEAGRLLDVQTVLLMPAVDGLAIAAAAPRAPHLEMLDLTAARWAADQNRAAGRGTDTLSASEWLFHPVAAGARVHGVFGIARADAHAPLDADQAPLL